jgi:hypothetical protein
VTVAHICSACGHRDWEFKPFERDGFKFISERETTWNGKRLALAPSENNMMILLASEDDKVSHDQLIANLSTASADVTRVYACRINGACRRIGAPEIAQSEWGYGYRWGIEPSPKAIRVFPPRAPKPKVPKRELDYIRIAPKSRKAVAFTTLVPS